jgi:hypothetical protein
MKYIYPKETKLENIRIREKDHTFLIYYSEINIRGILIQLSDIVVTKEYDNFKITLPEGNLLEIYDNLLDKNIKNYKKIIINDTNKYFNIPSHKLSRQFSNREITNITIYISQVKKLGFFNIPIINIL